MGNLRRWWESLTSCTQEGEENCAKPQIKLSHSPPNAADREQMCPGEGEKLAVMGARGTLMGKPGARDGQGMGGGTLPVRGTDPRSFLEGRVSSPAVRGHCFAHHWWQTPCFNPVGQMDAQQKWVQRWIRVPQGGSPSPRIRGPDAAGLGAASPSFAVSHGWCKRKQRPRVLG